MIDHRTALLPFCDGLRIDPVALGQRPQARLTILYCSTDCLCRCGAAVKNLSHSASFHSLENNASSNPGITQLLRFHSKVGSVHVTAPKPHDRLPESAVASNCWR